MKASQVTTRNRTTQSVIRSLAYVSILTFFAVDHTHACCEDRGTQDQVLIESRVFEVQRSATRDLGVHFDGRLAGLTPDVQQPVFNHNRGHTGTPINDELRQRRKEEELRLRRELIDKLKQSGVIRERGDATTTAPNNTDGNGATQNGNGNGPSNTTTPAPKPKPKVTKLPNGDRVTDYPDGRREIKMKGGDTVTTHPNGKRVIRRADGSSSETHPSGYRKTTDAKGNGTTRYPNGTRVDFKANGEATMTTRDGQRFHRPPGGEFTPVD